MQDETVTDKKKFVEYLHQVNKMHVDRQEDQIDAQNDLQAEVSKLKKILFEKENETKILITKHENELKKLQSELDVAKDFGNSHLREIENLKWV